MITPSRRLRQRAAAHPRSRPLTALVILICLIAIPGALPAPAADVVTTAADDLEIVPCPAEFDLGTDYLETAQWSTEDLQRYRCKWYEGTRIRRVETELGDHRLKVLVTVEEAADRDVEVKVHVSLIDHGHVMVTKKEGIEVDEGEHNREAVRLRVDRAVLLETRPKLTIGIDQIEGD